MKRCPKCGRTYTKDAQKFCTHDGGTLVPAAVDPNTTVSSDFPEPEMFNAPTVPISAGLLPPPPPAFNPYSTVAGFRPEIESSAGDPAPAPPAQVTPPAPPVEPTPVAPPAQVTPFVPPAQVAPSGPPTAAQPRPAVATHTPTPPVQPAAPVVVPPSPQKKSKMPLILGILAILLFLGVAGLAAGYFFFFKPMLEESRNLRVGPPANENSNANIEAPSPTAEATPTAAPVNELPPFVPPASAVEFVNSNANLDGKLAEHYLDFSFYYPGSWKKDPQAGVPGASSFVNVQQSLSDNPAERFAVGWYRSEGSFAADLPFFPKRVEDFAAIYGGGYPNYRKVSEGRTKVNAYDAYELRFQSVANDITTWGRVIFLPPTSGTNGATLFMLATSEQPEITSAEDVGVEGELPMILESFRLGKKE